MNNEEQFFDFAAEVGFTKHLGNVEATEKLVELCQITPSSTVLDVGCGAGVTPVYLARRYGCRVVGVDIIPRMVDRARERAEKADLSQLTELRVADAQELPFEDNVFDAVITESVTAFPEDKGLAVKEYARVTKPGGYVGLNESTWLRIPPPPEVKTWISQEVGATANPLTREGWRELMVQAGLIEISDNVHAIDVKGEARGLLKRYGFLGMMGIFWRMFKLYYSNSGYRDFVSRVRQSGVAPDNLTDYFGYGVYVGKKEV